MIRLTRISALEVVGVALVFALAVGPQPSLAVDVYFGNFDDAETYVLSPGAPGYAGWKNWNTGNPTATAGTSTTFGVVTGAQSLAWQPVSVGWYQGIAVKLQDVPSLEQRQAFFQGLLSNTHIAMNVTWNNDEWFDQYSGAGWNGAELFSLAINYGPGGTYQDQGFPDVDTGNPGNPGRWDLNNYPGVHNRVVMWDYSALRPAIQALYDAGTVNATNGYTEIMLTTNAGGFNHPITYYLDGWRFTSLNVAVPGDFNDDDIVDAADYTVWRDNLGAPDDTSLNGNGDDIVGVGQGDYDLWKASFGPGAGAGGLNAGAVPEPATWLLAVAAIAAVGVVRRRK